MIESRRILLPAVLGGLFVLTGGLLPAQTKVDLKNQTKNVDFSAATTTKPVKAGTALPSACTSGEVFFKSNAVPGGNLYLCTAVNTWTPSGVSSGSQTTDFLVSAQGASAVIQCTVCQYGIGAKTFVVSSTMNASNPTGTGGSATVFFYLNATGTPQFGYDGTIVTGATLTGLGGQPFTTSFPGDSIPLATCTVSGNQFTACTDFRALFRRSVAVAGNGIMILEDPSSGLTTYAMNPAVAGFLGGSNTWTGSNDFSGASHVTPAKTGTIANRPATCTVGELYFATDAATAGKNLHFCTAANTWTATP
ncbi:MAG: hypothetical protein ABI822_10540 [Bryobacteraceae bacterium]